MKKVFPFLFLGILSYASMPVIAQDMPSLRKKTEDIVQMKNHAWKLIRKQEREKEITYLWGQDEKADVIVTVFYGASEQEAAERMVATLNRLSVGPGKKRTDFGDEAYSWKTETRNSGGVRFRKGNVYVEVVASSAAIAEEMARSILHEIQKK